jgi:hypothetical protein
MSEGIGYKYSDRREVLVAKIDWKAIDGTVATVEVVQERNRPSYTVVFTYEVDGHWCAGTFTTYEKYQVGDTLPVRYDPNDPDRNDLSVEEKKKQWIIGGLVVLVAVIFILFQLF